MSLCNVMFLRMEKIELEHVGTDLVSSGVANSVHRTPERREIANTA